MDTLCDSPDNNERRLPAMDKEEFPDADNDEPTKPTQIILNICSPERERFSELQSCQETNHCAFREEPYVSDLLNTNVNYGSFKQNKDDPFFTMEVDPGEGYEGDVVIKTEVDWEDEVDIVDNQLDNLSECPRKRLRELKILLRKETEEESVAIGNERDYGDGEEKRYNLRQRTCVNKHALKSICESEKNDREERKHENIWSDDSDCDPDYTPRDDETEVVNREVCKKSKRKLTLSVKNSYRRKWDFKKIACVFCGSKYKNTLKHILTVHSNESEVKNINSLPVESEERKEASLALLKKIEKNCEKINRKAKPKRKSVSTVEINNLTKTSLLKWYSCFYCKKRLRKISRHLISNHRNEPYVKRIMRLPKGSEERKAAFKRITNKGNFEYNNEVIANGEGSLISVKTQKCQDQIGNFVCCSNCLGFYRKVYLEKHQEKCFPHFEGKETFESCTTYNEDMEIDDEETQKKEKVKRHRKKLTRKFTNRRVNACFYCKDTVIKISRHLIIHHCNKPYIKYILSLPKGSEERNTAWRLIRNKGNFVYNKEVIANGGTSVIYPKTPKATNQVRNLLPCSYCLGFYKKHLLQRHMEICFKKIKCKTLNVNYTTEDCDVDPTDCSPIEIIQNLVEGNLFGEEIDIEPKIRKKNKVKRTVCYYCCKFTTKLMRHLERFHLDKPDVKYVLSLEKGSKQRYDALQTIRRKGNFVHNKEAFNSTDEHVITRRISEGINKLNYFPCEYCFGFFTLNTLIKHVYKCERNTLSPEAKTEKIKKVCEWRRRTDIKTFSSTLLNYRTTSLPGVDRILLPLKKTKIGTIALNDQLIVKYGSYQIERGIMSKDLILRKMRFLARLVIRVNVFESSVTNLFASLNANIFKTLLKAALQMCMQTKEKLAVSLEKSLRVSIQHCCMIVKSDSVVQKDDVSLKQIDDFYALFAEHWSEPLLPTVFEANRIAENKASISDTGESELCDESTFDHIKKDILQSLRVNESFDSGSTDLECSSSLTRTRQNCCFFCNKNCIKMIRHWIALHKDEPEIKKLEKLEKFTSERKIFITALTNKGNHAHNKRVLEQKIGCLRLKRGHAVLGSYKDVAVCEFCLGSYKARRLPTHIKRCPLNPSLEKDLPISMKIRNKFQKCLMTNDLKEESPAFKDMVSKMKNDKIKGIVVKDDLIMKCGKVLLIQKPTSCLSKWPTFGTSNRLRECANILSHCQIRDSGIKSLRECFQPEYFGLVLNAIKELSLSKASKPLSHRHFLKLRYLMLMCSLILKHEFTIKNNDGRLKNLHDFEVMLHGCMPSTEDYQQFDNKRNTSQVVFTLNDGTDVPIRNLRNWRREEIDAVLSFFSDHIQNEVTPGRLEIEDFLNQHKIMSREWKNVKYQICCIISYAKSHSLNSKNKQMAETAPDEIRGSQIANHSLVASNVENKGPLDEITRSIAQLENFSQKSNDSSSGTAPSLENPSGNFMTAQELCDEMNLFSPKTPSATVGNQSHFSVNCPSDSEERTYLLLSSSDFSHADGLGCKVSGSGVKPTCLSEDAFEKTRSHKQLIGARARETAVAAASCNTINEKNQTNDSRRTRSTGSRNIYMPQKINEGQHCSQIEEEHTNPESKCFKKKGINFGWNDDETNAVLSFFSKNIQKGKIPSKIDCLECIDENECLNLRDWVSIKSKVYNIIRSNKKIIDKCKVLDNVCSRNSNESKCNSACNSKSSKRAHNEVVKQQWTPQENKAIDIYFENHIDKCIVPGKNECEQCISLNECLASRSWVMVKSKVHNIITTKKRRLSSLTTQ